MLGNINNNSFGSKSTSAVTSQVLLDDSLTYSILLSNKIVYYILIYKLQGKF